MELARDSQRAPIVRIVTIRNPQVVLAEGAFDNLAGRVCDVKPNVAMLMIAAGWARSDTRSRVRRQAERNAAVNRRQRPDRRSVVA